MFRNYLKTAMRFLLKNKSFSFINIIGLAIGTLCCLYILLYVQDQYSYDKHENNAANIYRITASLSTPGDKHVIPHSSPPIAPAMKRDFPEVLQFTRVLTDFNAGKHLLRYKEKLIYVDTPVYVDSTFFDLFTYHFTNGNAKDVLSEPYSVVLLKTTATNLFGSEDAVGKVIEIDDNNGKRDYKVTGVVDESLGKSHLHTNMFITMNSGGMGEFVRQNDSWAGNNLAYSFIKLRPDADAAALEKKLPAFLNKYGGEQLKALGMEKILHLQPLGSIHTTTGYEKELSKSVDPSFLYILLLIAILIQVIACINFMNLSTARASKRAKEVGVRKVVGAGRSDLMKQFMSESFLLSLISVILALPLLLFTLPLLNQITLADIHVSMFANYRVWLLLGGIIAITGLVAGSYPAFYLSAFQAIKVLKGNFTSHISASGIRRSLVVFQFVLSIILIGGIIVIYSQIKYIQHKDLGFDKNQKLVFSFYTQDTRKNIDAFTNDLRQLAEIKAVGRANNYLSRAVFNDYPVYLAGEDPAKATDVQNMSTDENFVKANGIKIISGRDFHLYDSGKLLVNETVIRRLGLKPEQAPGTKLYTKFPGVPEFYREIAGVMKDFNFNSLHDEVKPLMFIYDAPQPYMSNLTVATNSKNYRALLSKIEALWHKDFPAAPFDYKFLDQEVQKQYETEITLSRIINSFTLMAILISCLGLFGLAAFSAEQRKKEIGVRKVLGASISGVVGLLSKDFLKLVGIAILIATPVAWWAMNKWLQAFAYRVEISWWMFALAGCVAAIIAMITVSFQAIKAAVANPVNSLRTE
ncbi:MAG TPA: ABC transporter permease [Chitinophagaceae bacterium]|nr:ABC transporter permease [Chitinophagaceae bacterium]